MASVFEPISAHLVPIPPPRYNEAVPKETNEYTNGELTIVWKPKLCIHSGNCVKGLPAVFDPKAVPWIKIENASTEELAEAVSRCPSGALSCFLNVEKEE